MKLAVTGTLKGTLENARSVLTSELMTRGAEATAFGSGCASGIDTLWAMTAVTLFPLAEHHLFIPDAPSNAHSLLMAYPNWVIHECKPGRTRYESYFNRNEEMAIWADAMIAHPLNGYERMRGSGTWWTVRIAERVGTAIDIVPLNGGPVVRKEAVQA